MRQPVISWISLRDRLPPDRTFVLLTGPSGYISTPSFVVVGRRDEAFRPRRPHVNEGGPRWLDEGGDALLDRGLAPTHWAPLPNFPTVGGDEPRIVIELAMKSAAFEDDPEAELRRVMQQAWTKAERQLARAPGVVCDAPEADDVLLDSNGNRCGVIRVER
jgi:hypothetical protein